MDQYWNGTGFGHFAVPFRSVPLERNATERGCFERPVERNGTERGRLKMDGTERNGTERVSG